MPSVRASSATAGCWSSASIDSSPWIVDSAPELRLISPEPEMPSKVRPVAGSYIGSPAGLAPKYHAATIPARPVAASLVERVGLGGREQRLQPRVGAVGDLRGVTAGRQPAVVRAARGQQPRVEGERVADRRLGQRRVARARPRRRPARPGVCAPQACQIERDSAQGRTAPIGQCRASPPCSSAMPSLSCDQRRAGRGRPARLDVRREPEDGLGASRRRRRRSARPAPARRRCRGARRTGRAPAGRPRRSRARAGRARKSANAGSACSKAA